jgi:hypothetical protein
MPIRLRFLLGRRPRNNTPVDSAPPPLDPKVIDDMWLQARDRGLIDEKGAAAVTAAAAAQRNEELAQFLGELETDATTDSPLQDSQADTEQRAEEGQTTRTPPRPSGRTWTEGGRRRAWYRGPAPDRRRVAARAVRPTVFMLAAAGQWLLPLHPGARVALMVPATLLIVVSLYRIHFIRTVGHWIRRQHREQGASPVVIHIHNAVHMSGQLNQVGGTRRTKRGDRSQTDHEEGKGTAKRR